jgi:hypothetical protein
VEYFGRAKAAEMISNLIDGLDRNLADLRSVSDSLSARLLGHKLKGLADLYGLDVVAATALAIENGTSILAWSDVLARLEGDIGSSKVALDQFLKDLA